MTIIVPTTAGGGTDIIARIICDQLSMQLGQAFVIENRPGAGIAGGHGRGGPYGAGWVRFVRGWASAPESGALPKFNWSEPQAATLVGLTSRSLLELAIGIARGFIASGISRKRSTCRSPFSRLAPLT